MIIKPIVNVDDIQKLIRKDEIFSTIHQKYGSPPNWIRPQGFVSLSKIILEQQVSLASAKAHFDKLNSYIPVFTPAEILKLSAEEMRMCHISRQKARYLRALSIAIVNDEIALEDMHQLDEIQIRHLLTSIKGIGEWTADIYLMFCLQSKDIFPVGDIAVVNTVKEFTGLNTKDEIRLLAEKWKPLRSLAAYFCWHYYLKKRNR